MSLNMYVTQEVKGLAGFNAMPYNDGSGNKMSVDGITLMNDKGRLYAILGDENSVVPEVLKPYIEEFSFYEWIPQVAKRETGIYRYESAEAEVEDDWGGHKRPMYKIRIIGNDLTHIRELFRMIRIGSVRPDESYEGEQQELSRAELVTQLAQALLREDQLSKELRITEIELEGAYTDFRKDSRKNTQILTLAQTLCGEWCGLTRKKTIAARIRVILDAPSS